MTVMDYVDALMIVHSGSGAEFTGSDNDIWSHSWEMSSQKLHDGVYTYAYTMMPEFWQSPGDMTCGVYVHEFGHMVFGLPDLYDYDYSSEGLGNWSLMAGGSWNGPSGMGGSPALPDAWSRIKMGYAAAMTLTQDTSGMQIENVQSSSTVYKLWKYGTSLKEYFLIENRQQTGYDTYLPGNGLLIYHVDDNVSNNNSEWYPGYASSGHYHVALEQADGLYNLEKNQNEGDGSDPYPGTSNNHAFNSTTAPNTRDYSGHNTYVGVENISYSASTMTVDIGITVREIMIDSTMPTSNALNIARNTNITVTFNRDMNSSTLNDSTVHINGSLSGLHTSTFNYDSGTRTLTITPNTQFKVGEVVTVTFTLGIKSAADESPTEPYCWNFTVMVNTNNGYFQRTSTVSAGGLPNSATTLDVDGDGAMDLAVANSGANTVSILKNDGSGTFTQVSTVAVGSVPLSVTAIDVNGDGAMDLAVANSGTSTVSILKNNGSGVFTQTSTIITGNSPRSVTAGDWNGDGAMDLAVANVESISIIKNEGGGTFTQISTLNISLVIPSSIITADVDSDGSIDLIVGGNIYFLGFKLDCIIIFKNNGSGTFTETFRMQVGTTIYSVVAADIDGDGDVDLVAAIKFIKESDGLQMWLPASVAILKNDGSGTFAWWWGPQADAGNNPQTVTALDVDGDGDIDLAVADYISSNVSILNNNGSGTFTWRSTTNVGSNPCP